MSAFGEKVLSWLPAALGLLFPLLVKFEHLLVKMSVIGARGAIGIELVYLAVCCMSFGIAAGIAVKYVKQMEFLVALQPIVSILACIALVIWGIGFGAAIVYAT